MSKKMVNALKAKARESEYNDLRPTKEALDSGYETYKDLDFNFNNEYKFTHNFIINRKIITNDFINNLCSKHKNLIQKDEKGKENYRLFLKTVFTEMFVHAGAAVPNNFIMGELIAYYNRSGYMKFFSSQNQALCPFELRMYSLKFLIPSYKERIYMDCDAPNCLKFSFSTNEAVYNSDRVLICDLQNSVEFKLKSENGNVIYEEGKVSLTIPRKLKNYKVDDKNLFDIIVEYFQRACEKLGFKFETKIEHSLGKPLKVIDEPGISKGLNLGVNNPR